MFIIQSIFIMGVSSGLFLLVVQGYNPTIDMPISASASTIATALKNAANTISSSLRECNSFSVTKTALSSVNYRIDVIFQTDNPYPKTLLEFVDVSLTGKVIIF